MAFKRYARRPRRRKTPWYNKKYNAAQIAGKALAGVKYLKGLVNSEMLKIDDGGLGATITNTGSNVFSFTDIGQNDTASGRTGNSILLKSINIKMIIHQHASATQTTFRCILFQDNQQIADTTPGISNLLDGTSVIAFLNANQAGRFQVLKNWLITLDSAKQQMYRISHYQKFQHHVRYNGTAGTDIQKGGIYMIIYADEATNQPTLDYNFRTSYHDN